VELPAGAHEVEFFFRPLSVYVGLAFFVIGLITTKDFLIGTKNLGSCINNVQDDINSFFLACKGETHLICIGWDALLKCVPPTASSKENKK